MGKKQSTDVWTVSLVWLLCFVICSVIVSTEKKGETELPPCV
jgi:hypothetical protein